MINLRHFVDRWYSQLRKVGFGCDFSNIWFYAFKCWYCQSIVMYHFCGILQSQILKLNVGYSVTSNWAMTTSFLILSSSLLTTSVIRLLRIRITDSLVKETADNLFRCVALQAISYNMLVKLALFFLSLSLFSESNRCSWTYSVCYFQVTVGDSAVLRNKCQGNVGEFPCVGISFCALKIDLLYVRLWLTCQLFA